MLTSQELKLLQQKAIDYDDNELKALASDVYGRQLLQMPVEKNSDNCAFHKWILVQSVHTFQCKSCKDFGVYRSKKLSIGEDKKAINYGKNT